MNICGETKTAFEQSVCVVYLPLFALVALSKPYNIYNAMREFVEVYIIGIPLKISNLMALILKFSPLVFLVR